MRVGAILVFCDCGGYLPLLSGRGAVMALAAGVANYGSAALVTFTISAESASVTDSIVLVDGCAFLHNGGIGTLAQVVAVMLS